MGDEFLFTNSTDEFRAVRTVLEPNQLYVSSAGAVTQIFTKDLALFSEISFSTFDYASLEEHPHVAHLCRVFPDNYLKITEAIRIFKQSIEETNFGSFEGN